LLQALKIATMVCAPCFLLPSATSMSQCIGVTPHCTRPYAVRFLIQSVNRTGPKHNPDTRTPLLAATPGLQDLCCTYLTPSSSRCAPYTSKGRWDVCCLNQTKLLQ
jgi:hypothetical protein